MQKTTTLNHEIIGIAFPAIATNITVPLLGLCDSAIVGHLGSASYIGAIAVGGMCFNILYWLLGVLRMSTSGLTAQSYGSGEDTGGVLCRSLVAALALAGVILLLQEPFLRLCLWIMSPSAEVASNAELYVRICIWGAPAVLCQFAINGWMLGLQNARFPLYIAVTQNIVNIILSLFFVFGIGMRVAGVALGTMLAQWIGVGIALALASRLTTLREVWKQLHTVMSNGIDEWKRMMAVNRDLFLRTVCMVAVTLFFTSAGARQGDDILAVNSLLMQYFMFFSYFTDGFAFAGEALCGKYLGSGDMKRLNNVVRALLTWGAGLALLFTAIYWGLGRDILTLLTNQPSVIAAAEPYWIFVILVPVTGFAAFVWDGVMAGMTETKLLLYATLAGMVLFAASLTLSPLGDTNAKLWTAFLLYLTARSATQTYCYFKKYS